MHIHGNPMSSQLASLAPSQAAQQAMAAKRADAVVRRKLYTLSGRGDDESAYRVEQRQEADPDRRKNPHDQESFQGIFFSRSV